MQCNQNLQVVQTTLHYSVPVLFKAHGVIMGALTDNTGHFRKGGVVYLPETSRALTKSIAVFYIANDLLTILLHGLLLIFILTKSKESQRNPVLD